MVKRKFKKHHDYHHRKPRSLGKPNRCEINDPMNISHVSVVKHRAWHTLYANMTAQEIAKYTTSVWLDPDYYMVAVPRFKVGGKRKPTRIIYDCEEFQIILKEK
jgi:hypothetical protein